MNKTKSKFRVLVILSLSLSMTGCKFVEDIQAKLPSFSSFGLSDLQKASELYKQDKFIEAGNAAYQVKQSGKDYGLACALMAECLCAVNRYADAEVQARDSVRREPELANSHAALAKALMGQGKLAEAELQAKKALELPESPLTPISRAQEHVLLAMIYRCQAKPLVAEKELAAAIEADPKYAPGQFTYGIMLSNMGRYQEAEPFLRKAVELMSENGYALSALIMCLTELGKYDEASKLSDKLAAIAPTAPLVPVLQGNIFLRQGNSLGAADEARKALKMNPSFGPAYTILCKSLDKQEKYKEAIDAGEKATKLNPADPQAFLALAQALVDSEQWPRAAIALAAADKLSVYNKQTQDEVQQLGARVWSKVSKDQ